MALSPIGASLQNAFVVHENKDAVHNQWDSSRETSEVRSYI